MNLYTLNDDLVDGSIIPPHNHDGVYSKIGHTHDYASSNHSHSSYIGDIYVGDDGKLHKKTVGGADSVLNFSGTVSEINLVAVLFTGSETNNITTGSNGSKNVSIKITITNGIPTAEIIGEKRRYTGDIVYRAYGAISSVSVASYS